MREEIGEFNKEAVNDLLHLQTITVNSLSNKLIIEQELIAIHFSIKRFRP